MDALVGGAITHPLLHSHHQVFQHTRLDVAPRLYQLLHHRIGVGGSCHLPDLVCKIAQRFSIGLVQAARWPLSSPPEAGEVLLAPLLRLLDYVSRSYVLPENSLAGIG